MGGAQTYAVRSNRTPKRQQLCSARLYSTCATSAGYCAPNDAGRASRPRRQSHRRQLRRTLLPATTPPSGCSQAADETARTHLLAAFVPPLSRRDPTLPLLASHSKGAHKLRRAALPCDSRPSLSRLNLCGTPNDRHTRQTDFADALSRPIARVNALPKSNGAAYGLVFNPVSA